MVIFLYETYVLKVTKKKTVQTLWKNNLVLLYFNLGRRNSYLIQDLKPPPLLPFFSF